MKVILAGYNMETELFRERKLVDEVQTPEIFSAAYAKISRSSENIPDLRKEARLNIAKARDLNCRVIFDMGHNSVAEHAVFNFEIMDVSRLAVEEIESFRLVSYTEKSQRYVTFDGDFVLPHEVAMYRDRKLFETLIGFQNNFYKRSMSKILDYLKKRYHTESIKKLEGWAKEDARYILAMGTKTQVAMTINARNIGHLLRRFKMSMNSEVRMIGNYIYIGVKNVAPSIIRYIEPSKFEIKFLNENFKHLNVIKTLLIGSDVTSVDRIYNLKFIECENIDDKILVLLFSKHLGIDYDHSLWIVSNLRDSTKKVIWREIFEGMKSFDVPPREFEFYNVSFRAVVSASNFAQLKRHRMMSLVKGSYDIELGNTCPENIKLVGLEDEFTTIIERVNEFYLTLRERYNRSVAEYVLTNSHRRPVWVNMNIRELFHFARLRCDNHAQWDIRQLANQVVSEFKEISPMAGMLLCGKDTFDKEYDKNINVVL